MKISNHTLYINLYFIAFTIKYSILDYFVEILKKDTKKQTNNTTQIFSPEAQLVHLLLLKRHCISEFLLHGYEYRMV